MTTPCCKECRYVAPAALEARTLECHRWPPVMLGTVEGRWPSVAGYNVCGEFEALEAREEPEEDREVGCHLPHCGRGVRPPIHSCPGCGAHLPFHPSLLHFCPFCGFSLTQNPKKSPLAE